MEKPLRAHALGGEPVPASPEHALDQRLDRRIDTQ